MAYAADSDLNARYGTSNVALWADLDGTWVKGTAESAAMTARRLAARTYATALVEDILRTSDLNFKLPLTTVPTTIVDCCVRIAGYWLSSARGVKSFDKDGNPVSRLWQDHREALATLGDIVRGKLKLDL